MSRRPAALARYGGGTAGAIRLVRRDHKAIPPQTRALGREDRALLDVRAFELGVLRPQLEALRTSGIAELHTIDIATSHLLGCSLDGKDDAANDVKHEVHCAIVGHGLGPNCGNAVRIGFDPDPEKAATRYNDGLQCMARSKETFRRHPPQHGVFVWSIGYRLAEDGQVRARQVAGFRMAFDQQIHTLTFQFREGEVDTPIREITGEMISSSVLSAFAFYEATADADRSPF